MRRALRRQVLRALEGLPVAGLPKEKTALGTLASVRRRPPRLAGGILPHIGVTSGQPHPYSARERNHGRSSTARTRASVAESTPLSTITRRPHLTTISIRPGNDGKLIVEGALLISTGANVVASSPSKSRPSRASRHNVNNWLTDRLYRRAVAETCRRVSSSPHQKAVPVAGRRRDDHAAASAVPCDAAGLRRPEPAGHDPVREV